MENPAEAPPSTESHLARMEARVRMLVGMVAIQTGLLLLLGYVVFALLLAEPASVAGVTDFREPTAPQADVDTRIEMRQFFERMTDVLDREARRQGMNPTEVVPTQADLDNAIETRTMHSDESQRVLQGLREGFDLFDLTWPVAIPER